MKSAESRTLTIDRLAHDGRGIAHNAAGKTVFVEKALPGEQIEAAVHTQRKRFDEAHIKQRHTSASSRVAPPCPYFDKCGGCDLQHLEIDAQRAHKQRVVKELFARQGLALDRVTPLNGHQEHYRRRARLGVKLDSQHNVLLGFRAANSHRLVSIEHCHVLVPELSELIRPLHALLESLESPKLVGHVELIKPDGQPVLLIRQLKAHHQDARAWQAFADTRGISVGAWVGRETPAFSWYSPAPVLEDTLSIQKAASEVPDSVTLGFNPGDFLQVNAEVNQRMINQVLAWLAPTLSSPDAPRVLDLFAGIGNFGLPLALLGARVHAVEGSPAMVSRIAENAQRYGLAITAQQADLSQAGPLAALFEAGDKVQGVVLDPPRDGAEAICHALGMHKVPRVAYISCDPATLARDAAHLVQKGYRIKDVAVADMFLHTAHIETLVLFEYSG
ncbi:TRAM domain-containing protein [Vreelandella sp. EE22]